MYMVVPSWTATKEGQDIGAGFVIQLAGRTSTDSDVNRIIFPWS
jgi:hypothetical protein